MPTLLSTQITINNDNFKTLPSTYIEVVAAPGAGKIILPISGYFTLDTSAGAYTNLESNSASLVLTYGDWEYEASNYIPMPSNAEINFALFGKPGVTNQILDLPLYTNWVFAPQSGVSNQPIKVVAYNNNGDFTGGHASNTLKVTLYYVVADL